MNLDDTVSVNLTLDKQVNLDVATLTVRLLDTSLGDGPSSVVSELEIDLIRDNGDWQRTYSVELSAGEVNPSISYNVSAHLDVDESGQVSKGDYLTMQSYPVITFGHPSEVDIELRLV